MPTNIIGVTIMDLPGQKLLPFTDVTTCSKCGFACLPKGVIECKICRKQWCCLGCSIEDDSIDFPEFEIIYDKENLNEIEYITCCKCSGNPPSWKSEND